MSIQKKIVFVLLCIVLIVFVWVYRPQRISSLMDCQNKEIRYCTIVTESGGDMVQIRLTDSEDIAAFCNWLDSYTVNFHFWYDNITYDDTQDLYWIRMFYADNEVSVPLSILGDGRVFCDHIEYRLRGTDGAVMTTELCGWLENSENTDER